MCNKPRAKKKKLKTSSNHVLRKSYLKLKWTHTNTKTHENKRIRLTYACAKIHKRFFRMLKKNMAVH